MALEGIDAPFTEDEVLLAISHLPSDKAPGPDGFTGAFFKKCWGTIKVDVLKVIDNFNNLHFAHLQWVNSANIVLLPKKEGAEEVSDYRPISLVHAISKIVAKMISTRLAPIMNDIVSNAQSAFIKKRSIHDNFMYVKNLAKRLHRSKVPSLLFKFDIRKAFDSVRWDYILELLTRHGFPPKFRDWIAALFCTASSRILLNGVPGLPIYHGKGLRQGDPLSPLLFVLAIDPIQKILELATQHNLLHKIRGRGTVIRTSLYADDTAVFMLPLKEDIQNLSAILDYFGEATGLHTNFQKSSVIPIHCHDIDLDDVLGGLPVIRASFPIKYLGLPLSVWELKRVDFQPLEDKMAGKLVTWDARASRRDGGIGNAATPNDPGSTPREVDEDGGAVASDDHDEEEEEEDGGAVGSDDEEEEEDTDAKFARLEAADEKAAARKEARARAWAQATRCRPFTDDDNEDVTSSDWNSSTDTSSGSSASEEEVTSKRRVREDDEAGPSDKKAKN
ncbi:hypothetical protein QYE76_057347 [Lolium multiflorum]|uniref:Reverse transcriptase domain-containing protein n=1 Tax=Lolium multiflorum TaxID=4521 RepID=A0AAD8WQM8_LOLMU|nr:hypothetical protein QYE76_057347 [Lolium multiflorum]